MSTIAKRDRGLSVMKARHAESTMGVILMGLGLAVAVGMLVCDIWYSYEPAAKITNEYFAWFLAIISTPIEYAGMFLLLQKEQKRDMDKGLLYFFYIALPVSFAYDIVSNVAGLYNEALLINLVQNKDMVWAFAISIGVVLSFTEYLIIGIVRVLSAKRADLRICNLWLEDWEKEHEDNITSSEKRHVARGTW